MSSFRSPARLTAQGWKVFFFSVSFLRGFTEKKGGSIHCQTATYILTLKTTPNTPKNAVLVSGFSSLIGQYVSLETLGRCVGLLTTLPKLYRPDKDMLLFHCQFLSSLKLHEGKVRNGAKDRTPCWTWLVDFKVKAKFRKHYVSRSLAKKWHRSVSLFTRAFKGWPSRCIQVSFKKKRTNLKKRPLYHSDLGGFLFYNYFLSVPLGNAFNYWMLRSCQYSVRFCSQTFEILLAFGFFSCKLRYILVQQISQRLPLIYFSAPPPFFFFLNRQTAHTYPLRALHFGCLKSRRKTKDKAPQKTYCRVSVKSQTGFNVCVCLRLCASFSAAAMKG